MPEVSRHDGAGGGLKRNLQEHRVIFVRRPAVRPRRRGHVLLELKRRQECVLPKSCNAKPGPRHDVPVLGLDPIVQRQPQASCLQGVDDPPGRTEGRQQPGHQDVGVDDPDGCVIHAAPVACAPVSPP